MKKKNYLVLSALLLGLGLTGCGQTPAASSKPAAYNGPFTTVTEFDEDIDVRTADQKTFMEYDGDYAALNANEFQSLFHTVPNQSQSEANTIKIEWEELDNEPEKYEVEVATNEEFNDAWVFPATGNKAEIQNLFVNTEYFYRVKAIYDEDDVEYSKVYTLKTANVLPRIVNVKGMTNCRDLGGKVTASGAKIKQGMIYRTASLDDNQSGSIIDDTGRKTMLEQLKMKTEIDLRGGPAGTGGEGSASATATSKLNNENVVYEFIPFAYSNGKDNLFRNIIPVRKFFECFAPEKACYPAFFHCRIGTDRTGLCATLLNGLLGLSIEQIYQDYLFSNFGSIGKTSTVGQANEDGIAGYIHELQEFEGKTLQESVYNFLRTIGVKVTTLNSILENCLEGDLPTFAHEAIKNYGVADLTTTGEKKTDTTFRMPSDYIALTNGQKIEAKYTAAAAKKASIYLMMSAKTTSGTIANALTVKIDNTDVTGLLTTSFATTALGFGTNDWYWEPAKLVNEVSFGAGEHTISIESKLGSELRVTELILNLK